MKIYTRTGDTGKTGLFGGPRVSKHHIRIESYGTVDELNAVLGMVLASGRSLDRTSLSEDAIGAVLATLDRVQRELFVIGADLATPSDARAVTVRVTEDHVRTLESEIDALDADLAPLKRFILPGGSMMAAHLHLARTVCRRAERLVVALAEQEDINEHTIIYLNRLSDWLFTATRAVNGALGVPDNEWLPPTP
jgi:cob(I)alamin adenosyltransferase